MSRSEEIFRIEALILRHSARAVLIEYQGEERWIPKSQLFNDDELPGEGPAELQISAWIAKEKGFR